MREFFKSQTGKIPLPVFFPDATRAVLKTLDSEDLRQTRTPGVLVNTFHLYLGLGEEILEKTDGVAGFMGWEGGVISDSGGFQLMSLVKAGGKPFGGAQGKVTNEGVVFRLSEKRKLLFTPEESIAFQMKLSPDMLVVLDDFTPASADRREAEETVRRTVNWARRCKDEFEKQWPARSYLKTSDSIRTRLEERSLAGDHYVDKKRPYLLGVVQGGAFEDLRRECARELVKIGFDGLGFGGWPIKETGGFDYETAQIIAEETPKSYFLYGLGIGKPEEIVRLVKMGYNIFDCVLPTRDARHQRMYVFNAETIEEIDVNKEGFYSFYTPGRGKHLSDPLPVSSACDCLLCRNYSRAYLAHLFKIGEMTAGRLATIHNLRFYSILMEKLRGEYAETRRILP